MCEGQSKGQEILFLCPSVVGSAPVILDGVGPPACTFRGRRPGECEDKAYCAEAVGKQGSNGKDSLHYVVNTKGNALSFSFSLDGVKPPPIQTEQQAFCCSRQTLNSFHMNFCDSCEIHFIERQVSKVALFLPRKRVLSRVSTDTHVLTGGSQASI